MSIRMRRRQLQLFLLCILSCLLPCKRVEAFLVPAFEPRQASLPQSSSSSLSLVFGGIGNNNNDNDNGRNDMKELKEMEQQVLASAKAQVDYNQIVKALSSPNNNSNNDNDDNSTKRKLDSSTSTPSSPPWQISLAASTVTSLLALILFHNVYVSAFCFLTIFVVSWVDPVEDDNLLGSLARIIGRQTIQSYTTVQPTVRAVARAAVTGQEEVELLQQQIVQLEQENQELRQTLKIRETAQEQLTRYSLEELKIKARENGLPVGGTKLQVLTRLLEHHVLDGLT